MLDTTPGPFGSRGHVDGGRKRRRVRLSLVRSLRHARKRTERGEWPAAHHGHDERVGEVGEELMKTGGRRRSRRPNDEDEVGGGASGRLASRESTERRRRRWRSSWACRRGEGEVMAAVVASGGDEPVRVGERERSRGGNEHGGEREGSRGARGVSGDVQGEAASRRWPACGRGRRPRASRPPSERRRTTGRSRWTGPSWWARWVAPGKSLFSLSLSVFIYSIISVTSRLY